MDTVDQHFGDQWLENLKAVLGSRKPDYLVVQHMEPDHSANIDNFLKAYPEATVVSSVKAFNMMFNFFGTDYADRRIVVKEGDTLELGKHVLNFVGAPMVHWPEVLMTYDSTDKVLFSADGFGKFGALDVEEDWACEARRYYIGIVGKYGAQVQSVLKKAAGLEISIICPLHGPVLSENLGYYIDLYNTWSSYGVETDGIMIAYTSVYGHTKKAVEILAEKLRAAGITASVYLGSKKFGKQIDFAVKEEYSHVITMGGDELARGVVRVKDLSTREENELTVDAAIAALQA